MDFSSDLKTETYKKVNFYIGIDLKIEELESLKSSLLFSKSQFLEFGNFQT